MPPEMIETSIRKHAIIGSSFHNVSEGVVFQ